MSVGFTMIWQKYKFRIRRTLLFLTYSYSHNLLSGTNKKVWIL
jgi:hypothetical protein